VRVTYPTALVLQALLQGHHHGFDIMDATGLPSGTVYPILRRLDAEGYVRSQWEKEGVARREQRPPRRYYELTTSGRVAATAAVSRYRAIDDIAAAMNPRNRRGEA
jgi:DNA-binding PadR family transcriptional regulator